MAIPDYDDHCAHLEHIRSAAMNAADPGKAVMGHLRAQESTLELGGKRLQLIPGARILLIAFGKASPAMTQAAVEVLRGHQLQGLVAVPQSYVGELPPGLRPIRAGHPLPDAGSLTAGRRAAELLASTRRGDIVLCLISGGGSAMLELPLAGVQLADLRALNHMLLRSGAPIEAINTVRRALSQIKSGGLARLAAPAQVVALILSDVVGDPLASIASGPTVLRRSAPMQAKRILSELNLWKETPARIRAALSAPQEPLPRARRPINRIVGNNRLVVDAAARAAAQLGFTTQVDRYCMHGEARQIGQAFGARLTRLQGPCCRLMGGETTVRVLGRGRGGRNQELALGTALALDGVPHIAVMAYATDGLEGMTDAAGAMVTGASMARARIRGLDPHAALQQNDVYPLLDRIGALIRTGATGTNLNDLVVGLVYESDANAVG